jgi:hypothetical protein
MYRFIYELQIIEMDHDGEIPLHSAKILARRLRTAGNRLSRNTLLSSMCQNDSTDVE